MTDQEMDKIVLLVIEKVLTLMPETIGNLMAQHASNNKIKKGFYGDNPEFTKHTDVVAAVVDKLEGKELSQDYESLLKAAIPEIAQQIKLKDSLDTTTVASKTDITLSTSDNFGEL
jgi:hypothetical protein